MSLYTKDSIERVKDAVDMVALVGARSDLRRVGARYTGLCPFHDERTPSFSVNVEHKLYHCFGCGASGDALKFVQDSEGLDFRGAVELLAERTGIELALEQEDPRAEARRHRRERLLELVERATGYYARYLWDSAEAGKARAYLARRGLGEQILRDFRVGYAPSAWDRVVVAAQRDGFSLEEMAAAGLGQRGRQGGFHDRFRARIMFPLADARGRVLGFGARAARPDQRPKYLNSSENELYHKGRQLFGIDRARSAATKAGRVVAVEGYTDVLALHQVGVREAVAIMGTALTQEQLAELARAATTVYLALDADRAGQDAMLRVSRAAADRGVELRVVAIPEGRDPAELATAEGPESFRARLSAALTVPEFAARRVLVEADLDSPRGRDQALAQVRPLIGALPDRSATRDELVRHVADRLDLPVEYLTSDASSSSIGVTRAAEAPTGRGEPSAVAGRPTVEAVIGAERSFLAMCLSQPEVGLEYLGRIGDPHLSSNSLRRVRDHLVAHYDDPLAALPGDDPAAAALITDVVMLAEEEPSSQAVLDLTFLQLELRRVERELRHCAEQRDFERQRQLFGAREEIREQIADVMGQTV